jgi:hypothetical protein
MAVFEAIELEWKGKTYTIPPKRVLEAIAAIEDHITLAELDSERPRMAKLSRAFASALKIAGVRSISADDVYEALFGEERDAISSAAFKLMLMMLPPKVRAKADAAAAEGGGEDTEGNASAPTAMH